MEIRRATTDEAKGLKAFDEFIGDRRLDLWRGELFVCDDGGAIAGFVTFSSNLFYNRPFVNLLCVRDASRRRGIATALMSRVLDAYEGLDVWTSTEQWNAPAIALFAKLGFAERGRIAGLDSEGSVELFLVRPDRPAGQAR